MSSHRDFTPDDDHDELLLEPSSPRDRRPSAQTTPAVTSIRLKIGAQRSKTPSSKSSSAGVKHEPGDTAETMQRVPSPTEKGGDSKPFISDGRVVPASRKRVLSNPSEPPADDSIPTPGGSTARKRTKVATTTGKKPKRTPKTVTHPSELPDLPSPGIMYMEDGDDLLADELSLMDEEVAKRSTPRGSSPPFSRDVGPEGSVMATGRGERLAAVDDSLARLASPSAPVARHTPESSPEITLLENNLPRAGGVVVPIPAAALPAPRPPPGPPLMPHLKKKRKAWMHQAKTVPVAIAPNPGFPMASVQAAAGTSHDAGSYTPDPAFHTIDKRKVARKSRAIKGAHLVSSSHLVEAGEHDPAQAYSLPPPDGYPERGDSAALGNPAVSLDGGSDVGGGDPKPKKKKSRKLKPGEVGPGKHWRKGVFGPHSARQIGPDGTEMGGESPRSGTAGSSHGGGRLILPRPTGVDFKRVPSGMGHAMFPAAGETDPATPDFDEYDNASNRSSPEILMRNDPTIALPRSSMQTRGSLVPPPIKPKPLLEGAEGQYIVPKAAAQVDELGHPVYRNSILTRGISIIRIQDFSGAKAKERELTVPRALKDNLGPEPRQFAEGYRVITGVGGAKLKFRSWIPRTVTSQYRIERDAKIDEIRASSSLNTDTPTGLSRPGLFASVSQRSMEGMKADAWVANQAQIHLGQQVRKISAYAQQSTEMAATPPKKPVKKKKKKKVVKSAPELIPHIASPLLDSVAVSAAASPEVGLNDPMDAIPLPPSRSQFKRELSPTSYVDDLIMDTV